MVTAQYPDAITQNLTCAHTPISGVLSAGVISKFLVLVHQRPNDVLVGRKRESGIAVRVGFRGVQVFAGIDMVVTCEQCGTVAAICTEPNSE